MVEEASLEFRLRKTDETRNYLLGEIKHNDLMSEKYKKTCKYLNYVEHLLILASAITRICFISLCSCWYYDFCSRNKHLCNHCRKIDKTVLLGKDKFNTVKVLIYKSLTYSYISHDNFVSVNNVLREYNEMKK